MFLLIFVLTKNMTVCFIFIRVAIDEKYFMREGKKGENCKSAFLMLTAKRILLGKKVFDDSFPGAPMKEDSF